MFARLNINPVYNTHRSSPGYRFTKGLTQNLNLRTNLKLKYKIKSLNYIQASFLYYLTMSFTFLHGQWFKSYYSRK